jgi:hypothetical protein
MIMLGNGPRAELWGSTTDPGALEEHMQGALDQVHRIKKVQIGGCWHREWATTTLFPKPLPSSKPVRFSDPINCHHDHAEGLT